MKVWDPAKIPDGWGAHIGGGEWVTKCPSGCGHLIPGTLPVDIQNHLWDAHNETAPLLP
jgi:hypothetical protein